MSDSSARTVSLKFEEAFKQPFVSATYYNNFGKWKSLSADAQMRAIVHGCTPEGEWLHIFRNYKGKGKALVPT
jgi:hypothetical protein